MISDALTRDHIHLTRHTNGVSDDLNGPPSDGRTPTFIDQSYAITCTSETPSQVPDHVAALIEASIAENTRWANRCDLAHFEAWGGQLPADPAVVASYLAAHSETHSVATLVRRMATISKVHEARGLPNPSRSEVVRATLRGIKRTRGIAQREAKPLLREDLFRVLDAMGDGVKDARDAAELLRAYEFCSRSRKFFSDYQDHSPHRQFFRAHSETGWTSLGSRAMSCDDGSAVVSRPPPR